MSVSKNVTSEIRQKAPKAYPFLLKSVMCSFWRMAFASTYIQSCDEEAIQVQQHNFALELPPTFCVLNQQPFLLFVKILCALSTGTYSMSSTPSLSSHL